MAKRNNSALGRQRAMVETLKLEYNRGRLTFEGCLRVEVLVTRHPNFVETLEDVVNAGCRVGQSEVRSRHVARAESHPGESNS